MRPWNLLEPRTLLDAGGPRITAITPTEVHQRHVRPRGRDLERGDRLGDVHDRRRDRERSTRVRSRSRRSRKLDDLDYRISFDALSVRGTYQIVIGPNIADLPGQPDGPEPERQPAASRRRPVPVVADLRRRRHRVHDPIRSSARPTRPTTARISRSRDATVTIDGPHSFNSVHLIDGAVLTHSANTATQTHKLDLTVTQQVIVDASSKIDVTGKGYLPGYTTGNTTVGGAPAASGGSYGGLGASDRGATNAVYGDYADPDDWGSGG